VNAYKSFSVTVTGGHHIKHGYGCEDSSGNYDDENIGISIAVVADGHGDDNCFRSAKGAELAVECAIEGMHDFIEDHKGKFPYWFYENLFKQRIEEGSPIGDLGKFVENNKGIKEALIKVIGIEPAPGRIFSIEEFEKNLKGRLIKYLIESWHKKVIDDYETNPFKNEELEKTDEKHRKIFINSYDKGQTSLISTTGQGSGISKAYGTTLITAAITNHYWFGIHIGDGRLTALYPDGSFDQPVPWDERCYLNVTTSVCDSDALEGARSYFSFHAEKTPPVAVFLCTDGIDDTYPVKENEKHLFKLYQTIALTFAEEGFEKTCEQLKDLANQFAAKGDDTSIAGFINMEALKQAVPFWQKKVAGEEGPREKAANGEENAANGATAWTPNSLLP